MPAGNPGGYARGGSNAAVEKMLRELIEAGGEPKGRGRAAAARSPGGLSRGAGGGGDLAQMLQMPQGGGMSDQGQANVARATRMLANKDPGTSMKDAISGELGGEMDALKGLGGLLGAEGLGGMLGAEGLGGLAASGLGQIGGLLTSLLALI